MNRRTFFFLSIFLAASSPCFADGIRGTATRTDGSKVDGTVTISTSWNGQKAFPKRGVYELDLGSAAGGQKITVYVNGYKLRDVTIPKGGFASVNVVMKGSSDIPVR